MKKVIFFIITLLAIITNVSTQTNVGKIFYAVKDYELAKKIFQQELSNNPGEANYYLGEIAFAEGNLEEAAHFFNQGLSTTAEPYCRIGLAKINLSKDQKSEAFATFLSLQKKYSGDMDIMTAIGYAYLDNKLFQNLESHLKDMQKINKQDPRIYILEGDMIKVKVPDKTGDATGKYEMALYFDSKYDLAYIKLAEIYENSSWQIAVEKLNDLIERNPNYIIAYRYLGRIYTNKGYYPKAIEAFNKFFEAKNYTLDDIAKFVQALFFSKNYDDAYIKIKEGLAIAPNHFVLNRLRMYVAANTMNLEDGLEYAKKFFSLKGDNIALDFSMYALLLKEAKMYDEAIEQYKRALELDNTTIDMYKEMGVISTLKGQNGVAADYYNIFIEKKGKSKVEILDILNMGRYYYMASTVRNANDTALILARFKDIDFVKKISDSELQLDSILADNNMFIQKAVNYYMNQADKAFDMAIEINPDSYQGHLWKARTNSLMDPDSELGLAKPHYEKIIEMLAEREDKSAAIITALAEGYRYLAFFYYQMKDFPTAIINCEKLLELVPDDNTGIQLLKFLKK